jgi:hypothetical protein
MGSAKIGATKTHEVLDKIDSLPPNAASLHTIRKELNDISGVGGNEGASARYARDMIDHFLEKPPPNAVLTAPQEGSDSASSADGCQCRLAYCTGEQGSAR